MTTKTPMNKKIKMASQYQNAPKPAIGSLESGSFEAMLEACPMGLHWSQ